MPTFSYLAYGNEQARRGGRADARASGGWRDRLPHAPQDPTALENRLRSMYDQHTDGSGVCYASLAAPAGQHAPEVRPDGTMEGAPHQFNADLHIVDWLHETGYAFDVVTDEDLHHEGAELLASYNVVLTGSHREYWSLEMLAGAQAYLSDGGRLMYLGGNGMYWVTRATRSTGTRSRSGGAGRRPGPGSRSPARGT